jgi:citrate lyase alpha subunit
LRILDATGVDGCRSFVINFAVSSVINRSIWVLSQLMIKGSFSLNVIALSSLLIKIASFAVCDRANSSASVLDAVPFLFALQAIGP